MGRLTVVGLCVAAIAAAARPEHYLEYVTRSFVPPDDTVLADILNLTAFAKEAARLAEHNDKFMAELVGSTTLDARIAVPLLVGLVRDWSADGAAQRNSCYAPILEALGPALSLSPQRVLVPGSGLGRLAYELASAAAEQSEIVAIDSNLQAQTCAANLMAGKPGEASCDGGDASPASGQLIHPSLHVATNWASSADRLRAVRVPDVPADTLRRVQERVNVSIVVGSFPVDPMSNALDAEPQRTSDSRSVEHAPFDAVATAYFLDVAVDVRATLRALHAHLQATRGVWANCGPLAFPEDAGREGGASGEHVRRPYALSGDDLMALVRAAGFAVEEERWLECEYQTLPRQMVRTAASCLFFVARPARMPSAPAPHRLFRLPEARTGAPR